MTSAITNRDLSAFFAFADGEMRGGRKRSVARFGDGGGAPLSVVAASGFGHEFVGNVFRSARTKEINNGIRQRFLTAVLQMMGQSDVEDLPPAVRTALRMDDYGKGLPLTARRIAAVKAAVLDPENSKIAWQKCTDEVCGLIRGAREGRFGARTSNDRTKGMSDADFNKVREKCILLFGKFQGLYRNGESVNGPFAVLALDVDNFIRTTFSSSLRNQGAWDAKKTLDAYEEKSGKPVTWETVRNGELGGPFALFSRLLAYFQALVTVNPDVLQKARAFLTAVLKEICANDVEVLRKCWPGEDAQEDAQKKAPNETEYPAGALLAPFKELEFAEPEAKVKKVEVKKSENKGNQASGGYPEAETLIEDFVRVEEDGTAMEFPIVPLMEGFLAYYAATTNVDVMNELKAWQADCKYAAGVGFCLGMLEKRIGMSKNDLANQVCVKELLGILREAAKRSAPPQNSDENMI